MSTQRASGVATMMFTDVEASTELTTREGDGAAASCSPSTTGSCAISVAAHGGRHRASTGDGFLVMFDSARRRRGVRAESIQRELAAQEDGIRVRIGLNTGEVVEGEARCSGRR